jgi:hypothetical protein
MKKIFALALFFSAHATAAPSLPPGELATPDPFEALQNLDRDLRASALAPKLKRQASLEEFREDLQMSVNGHEAQMEKFGIAPEYKEAAPRK